MSATEAAAEAVALARHKAAEAAAAVEAANDAVADIQARVDALNAERSQLIAAARSGDSDGRAALRMGVVDADLADLKPLVADARAGVQRAGADAAKAAQAVLQAEQQLAIARDGDLEARLVEHAAKLDALLVATLNELSVIWKRRNARPTFAPSGELFDTVTKLTLLARQLRK